MPQTILAFLAVLLLTALTLDQRDSKMRAYRARMGAEMELVAHGVGIGTIEMIGAKAFDEATKSGQTVNSTDELTEYPFADDGPPGVRDDIDDFHGAQLVRMFETKDDTMRFVVDVTINYVNGTGEHVSERTYNKEIEVAATPYDADGTRADAGNTVTLKRPVSYAPHQ